MKNKLLYTVILTLVNFYVFSQDTNSINMPKWEKLGYFDQSWENDLPILSFDSIKIVYSLNDCDAINYIFNNFNEGHIKFNSGTYEFDCSVELKSNFILEGTCADSTKFNFSNSVIADLINISGNVVSGSYQIEAPSIGNRYFILSDALNILSISDKVAIEDDDLAFVTSSWAEGQTGQFLTIKNIIGDTCFIYNPIRRNYNSTILKKLNPIQNIRISKIFIEPSLENVSQTNNIKFNYAHNCKIESIKSEKCSYSHISINKSSNIEVENSFFKDGFSYGGGGRAYGVVLQFFTSDCYIHDNCFNHLRHSMLLQAGANGNCIAYNYSIDPFWTDVTLPSNSAGDIVLHGNYPYKNLFEGNVCQHIVIDDSHGKNGPGNIFFRNRAELYGIFMNSNPASDSTIFIGNEVTNTEFLLGNYILGGQGNFEYGNNVQGNCIPSNTEQIASLSLFNYEPLFYYSSDSNWPPIGYSNQLNEFKNHAQYKYENNLFFECSTNSNVSLTDFEKVKIKSFPNPAMNGVIQFKNLPENGKIKIYDNSGRLLLIELIRETSKVIDLTKFDQGIYHVNVYSNDFKYGCYKFLVL